MAQNIVLTSGSPLIGCPVLFRITAENLSAYQQAGTLTFHRVKLKATISAGNVGIAASEHELSKPVPAEGANVTVDIDISSALRAVADVYEHTPHTTTGSKSYPVFSAHVEAWDEYMINGHTTSTTHIHIQGNYSFLLGSFTDIERITSGVTRGVTTLTRKPSTGEVIPATGNLFISPSAFTYSATDWAALTPPNTPATVAVSPSTLTANAMNTIAGRSVYVSSRKDPWVELQFVNGYGVLESVYAQTLPEESVKKKVSEYSVTVPQAFNKINRNIVRKRASRHVFHMSSGPVTEAWQHWWQEEFLNTPSAWIYYNQLWIPVSIVPDEDTAGLKHHEDKLPTVEFDVKLNIEGI